MKRIIYLSLLSLALVLVSCRSNPTTASYVTYETECLGVELDGSQTLYAWGTGKNKSDAQEQARKNAVYDVIFKGIRNGSQECDVRPLVNEANAREKYENYFNTFFQDGGEYKNYLSNADTRRGSYRKETNDKQEKQGLTVRVLRSRLKQRLIQDNIIKQ